MDRINLIGSDDVLTAGRKMKCAAEEMSKAAQSIENTLELYKQFMRDWLSDFDQIVGRGLRK